jgi:hypothetical protein
VGILPSTVNHVSIFFWWEAGKIGRESDSLPPYGNSLRRVLRNAECAAVAPVS